MTTRWVSPGPRISNCNRIVCSRTIQIGAHLMTQNVKVNTGEHCRRSSKKSRCESREVRISPAWDVRVEQTE